ncbi:DNA polymerase III subunit alpha [Virgibacillus phasianinus]|uniref:DNA polymerase III subunit alpha n=1 Tax=Virgibacillus phasianinus TaxID=2017483 RepID=A0A220U491_9BACI|nr:DNA polymerase III subunit alpha [Virgibacillus phasianinus]ASK62978.1 DNA polymerase III subunit alpha [Virgibacillus phasianinus]
MSFTHLQVKSGYSLMESTIRIDRLVEKAVDHQFHALALTDDQVLYGAIPFYKTCQKHGIKPIIGMNVFISDDKTGESVCILLAKNNQGYQQLMKLSTFIQTNSQNSVELEQLNTFTGDLIGIVPVTNQKIINQFENNHSFEQIDNYLAPWKQLFASDDFYLGVEDYGTDREKELHEALHAFSEQKQVKMVAINDVKYLDEKDNYAFDCLQAMKKGKQWAPNNHADSTNHHLRSTEDMNNLFRSFWPEVLEASDQISEKCNVEINFGDRLLPSFPVPGDLDAHTYLEEKCWSNLNGRYTDASDEVKNRLRYELSVIKSMGFSDYFLIVWDFINYAKKHDIAVGPGRGSAAGSLVAFVLSITDVDPIKHRLIFERFLNPERVTMPDIDIDFSDNRRDEVIDYVRDKYGTDHVAQIITFGTFAARSLLRELIKTMGIEQQDAYYLLKEIPVQANKPLLEYIQASEDLKMYIKQSASLKTLFSIALKLEGLPRHVSTHAAGVVISEKPLVEYIPLTFGSGDTRLTQYPMNELEAVGLLKMDFLGLRNLTLLERVVKSIAQTHRTRVKLGEIPNGDEGTFQLLKSGKTNGVFQLESTGMKQVLRKLKPTSFEDIVAVNALYRPGPMEYIPIYISRKHGQTPIKYPHPDLEPILKDTYGVLIYQEQIMQIANQIAGFSLGEADILRRAVSKKKHELMENQKKKFIAGCLANGYDETIATEIFNWIVQFANYGFNLSHAVAYSQVSYQLAYLKTHYPASFFAELLSSIANQQDKVHQYRKEAKTFDIEFLPPDINKSFGKYTVEDGQIRMGLLSIKGIGNQVVKEIVRARKSGPFKSIFDLCLRISTKAVNRQALELLIIAGALDETFDNRASLLASIDHAMEQGELFREFADQPSLFQDKMELEETYVEMDDFSLMKKLSDEKELMGIYISSHPLASYRQKLRGNGLLNLSQASSMAGKRKIKSAAIVQAMKTIRTKRGDPMAFITFSDETSDMEGVIFPDLFREVNPWLHEEELVIINGKIEERNNKLQWVIQEIQPFKEDDLTIQAPQQLFVKCRSKDSGQVMNILKEAAVNQPGSTPVIIHQEDSKITYQLASDYFLHATSACIRALRLQLGEKNVALKKE